MQRQKYPISELAEAFRVGVPVEELEQWRAKAKRRPAKRRYYGYYEGLHCGKLGGVCTNPRCTSNNCILAKPHFCAELDGVPEAQQREREEARRASMEFEATLEEALLAANKKPEGSD